MRGILTISVLVLLFFLLPSTYAAELPSHVLQMRPAGAPSLSIPQYTKLQDNLQKKATVRVIVRMAPPADLPGGFVLEARLKDESKIGTQRAALSRQFDKVLAKIKKPRADKARRFQFIPYLALEVDSADFSALIASPEVDHIAEDVPRPPILSQSVPLVGGVDGTFSDFSGNGQSIAILDTGVDHSHPFLTGKVVAEACYSTTNGTATAVCTDGSTAPGSGTNCSNSDCAHGSHVAGIAAGSNATFNGVARSANLISIQVFSLFPASECGEGQTEPCVLSYDSDQILGLQQVYSLRNTYAISSVNLSLGGGSYSTTCDSQNPAYKQAVDNLRAVGIATLIATGNNGYTSSVAFPSCVSSAIRIGATSKSDVVASFSNSASLVNLLAPGVNINSSIPGGGYASYNGTSMATPHVAGAWAVLKSFKPTASVDEILNALTTTGVNITDARNGVTKPRIKVDAAITSLKSGSLTSDQWTYYTINLPTPQNGLRLVLTSTASSDFYLYSGSNYTSGTNIASSTGKTLHTLLVPSSSLTDGGQYHVRIHANANLTYSYTPDFTYIRDLTWDLGTTLAGTNVIIQPDTVGGDYLFKITAQAPLHPAWRHMLQVTSGEADIYLQQNSPPLEGGSFNSTKVGSDTIYLNADSSLPGQEWYIRVHATPGSTWGLTSGDLYVQNLTWDDGSTLVGTSALPQPSTEEGDYFYRLTTQAPLHPAWRHVLQVTAGEADIYLQQTSPPLGSGSYSSTKIGSDAIYLNADSSLAGQEWYIRVHATPGSTWKITSGDLYVQPLAWDDGTALVGTSALIQPSNADGDYFYQITTQAPIHSVWRTILKVAPNVGEANFYLQQNSPPITGSTYTSTQAGSDKLYLSADASLAGQTWYLRVNATGGATWKLFSGDLYAPVLPWDPGTEASGSNIVRCADDQPLNCDLNEDDDYFFKVTSAAPADSAWRTVLDNVTGGEANFYLQQHAPPLGDTTYQSTRIGSDGIILESGQFSDNQTWYIRVNTAKYSNWKLFSGYIHVMDLGNVVHDGVANDYAANPHPLPATNINKALNVTIGPEGTIYFRATIDANTQIANYQDWRLWVNNATTEQSPGATINLPVIVRKGIAPALTPWIEQAEQKETGQMLLVPPYLANGVYYAGVVGTPGTLLTLDSRKQQILLPNSLPGYSQGGGTANFDFTLPVQGNGGGFGYLTYRIDVPVQQIAWQVSAAPTSGNPELYIRKGDLPNRWMNDAYSEAPATVTDSIAQVPPTLTDGTWYVTLYGAGNYTFTLKSGVPEVTGESYINDPDLRLNSTSTDPHQPEYYNPDTKYPIFCPVLADTAWPCRSDKIINDDTNRAGWRYYQVSDINSQLGYLGWRLALANQVPGSEIALRRNAVPARWRFRNGGSSYSTDSSVASHVDRSTTRSFIQLPNNQADIWYYGIYTPHQALGTFNLTTSEIPAPATAVTSSSTVNDQYADTWKWLKFTIPSPTDSANPAYEPNFLGWDLRLKVTAGNARMVVRRDLLPENYSTTYDGRYTNMRENWPTGYQWGAGGDTFTGRTSGDPNQYLTMGLGSPLEAGTYYVGVSGDGYDTTPLSYSLESRAIGVGNNQTGTPWPIQVHDLGNFVGGSVSSIPQPQQPATCDSTQNCDLDPREIAYYKVTVPEEAKSWSLKLEPAAGHEALLAVRHGRLPNNTAGEYRTYGWWYPQADESTFYFMGTKRQKSGREFFYKYPADGTTTITPGTYYLAVISEGQNPPDDTTIGTGAVSYTLTSNGEVPIDGNEVALNTAACNGGSCSTPPVLTCADPLACSDTVSWTNQSLQYGQQKVYRLRIPANLWEVRLRVKSSPGKAELFGNPTMMVRQDAEGSGNIPSYVPYSNPVFSYAAQESGSIHAQWSGSDTSIRHPEAGDYTLVVGTGQLCSPACSDSDAEFDVEVSAVPVPGDQTVDYFNNSTPVAGQEITTWRYFQYTIPSTTDENSPYGYQPNFLGWDLRLKVTAGNARMVVRRDLLPENYSTTYDGRYTNMRENWPTGYQWGAGGDTFTGRTSGDPNQYLTMGLGSPLEAGTYYVGVSGDGYDTTPLSYSLESRAIGMGNNQTGTPWPIQVHDLGNFVGGSVSTIPQPQLPATCDPTQNCDLDPREVAYYRVTVPEGAKSWSLKLEPTAGHEALLAVRHGRLPNNTAGEYRYAGWWNPPADESTSSFMGTKRQKSGREFFYKYPADGTTTITPGTYYLAVISEGQNPPDDTTIGTGAVSYTLTSNGEVPIDDRTSTPVTAESPNVWIGESLHFGEQKIYRFRAQQELGGLQVRLKNRIGNPVMMLRQDAEGSGNIPGSVGSYYQNPFFSYPAQEGGVQANWSSGELSTFPNPSGDYTLVVGTNQACLPMWPWTCSDSDAGFDVEVKALVPVVLPISGAAALEGHLVDQQVAYYKVEIPQKDAEHPAIPWVNGYEIVGWKLKVMTTSGNASLRVAKGMVPGSTTPSLAINAPVTIVAPPYLSPGTWYVEVKGAGITDFAIESDVITTDPLKHSRTWEMPDRNNKDKDGADHSYLPLLPAPYIGDSGINEFGNPIVNPNTGDQGTDLAENDWHFYRILVPANNAGHLQTIVEALSGKPEIYLRTDSVPSPYHNNHSLDPNSPWAPIAYDRSQTLNGTMYGNWVPLDPRVEAHLPTGSKGEWWIGIRAVGSNVRYRLKVAAGNVRVNNAPKDDGSVFQDLEQSGPGYSNQTLAAGNMRYYRVTIPQSSLTQADSTPRDWNLSLQQQTGDVRVFIRDTVPPGNGLDGNNATQWPGGGLSEDGYIQEWSVDNSSLTPNPYIFIDTPGSYKLDVPPVKPGKTYYLGVYAVTDAAFDINSTISPERLTIDGTIDFTSGTVVEANLIAGSSRLYRIDVPDSSVYWHHTSQHDSGIKLYIQQDTIPPTDSSQAHWSSCVTGDNNNCSADSSFNKYLYETGNLNNYPWQPGHSYYLLVKNTTGSSLPFSFNMGGRNSMSDLSVTINGTGSGSVTSSLSAFTCTGGTCNTPVVPYTQIWLSPNPVAGTTFTSWGGDCAGQGWYCYLTMGNDMNVTANFAADPITGSCGSSNGGTFASTPSTDLCSTGTPTTVTPVANGWTWICEGLYGGTNDNCSASINHWSISVTMAGSGSGMVNSVPSGIACSSGSSSGCTASFPSGSPIDLFASPSYGSLFNNWSIGCTGTGTCSITLTADTGVTALFSANTKIKLDGTTATYATIQDAYNAANDGETFLMQVYSFLENLTFNRVIRVKLNGGRDSSYNSTVGVTTIQGSLIIEKGSVEISKVVIW